ncbi:MAG: formylglycine-generating enzyme family protein [Leptospiraceae bacterium]|nr:formylglycine-generating enzyme family protein [Leptospiraceae bacterium]MCP5497761.1 formylglycine-generating enzyme family protein [Leptospiraceae bacterium]
MKKSQTYKEKTLCFLMLISFCPLFATPFSDSDASWNNVLKNNFPSDYLASLNKDYLRKYTKVVIKEKNSQSLQTFTNSIGIEFILIPAGEFNMGCNYNDFYCDIDEIPRHRVRIIKPFYMSKYEVTQKQWVKIMGYNPSYFQGENHPVERISWDEAKAFIKKLNKKEHRKNYRLPTEAEWEYAARGSKDDSKGIPTKYYWGNKINKRYAWYWNNSNKSTHVVGQKYPNGFGLYDMSGNVWEWCEDSYDESYYLTSPKNNPINKKFQNYKVIRGGSWFNQSKYLRTSNRVKISSNLRISDDGMRLVFSP